MMRAEAKRGAVSPLLRDLFRWPDAAFAAHSQPIDPRRRVLNTHKPLGALKDMSRC